MQIRPSMLVTLGLLSGLTPFAIDMYLPSLPAIAHDLGSTMELAQISVTVYLGVFALAQLFMGPLSDMLGRRATIGGGLVLFCLGALGCALAGQMGTLLLGRAVQAVAGIQLKVEDFQSASEVAEEMQVQIEDINRALIPKVAG